MTFQSEFQAVETDQHTRLCAAVSKTCEPFIEWDAPFDGFVFQDINRHLRCKL